MDAYGKDFPVIEKYLIYFRLHGKNNIIKLKNRNVFELIIFMKFVRIKEKIRYLKDELMQYSTVLIFKNQFICLSFGFQFFEI